MRKKLDPIEKAAANPQSMRCAINGKCWDCIGGNADPSPRWRIGNCESKRCSLYTQRPYQKLHKTPTPKCLRGNFDEQ